MKLALAPAAPMTQARSTLIPPGHAVFVHVTTRCVRRAWLFGRDRVSNRCYDHRCGLIEARVRELAEVFAVGVYAYAWMGRLLVTLERA